MASQGATELPKACFQNLSLELIEDVLRLLCPMDILSVRQTCRALCRATHINQVWADALHRECARYGVFEPTFPIDKMTKRELEHAATSSARFLWPVRPTVRGPGRVDDLRRYQTREVIFRRKGRWQELIEDEAVDQFILIPGGRFLLACSRRWGNEVFLWDLGYASKTPLPQFPIAEGKLGALEAVSPTPDGKKLLVAAQKKLQGTMTYELSISKIKPDQQSPKFDVLGALSIEYSGPVGSYPARCARILPNKNFIVFQVDSYLAVWGWAEGKGCKWRLRKDREEEQYLIYACDTSVIAWNGRGTLFAWDIPIDIAILEGSSWRQLPVVKVRRWTIRKGIKNDPEKIMMSPCSSIWQQNGSTLDYLVLLFVCDDDERLRLFSVQQRAPDDSEGNSSEGPTITVSHLGYRDCYAFAGTCTALSRDSSNVVLCTGTGDGSAVLCTIALPAPGARSATKLAVTWSSLTPSTAEESTIKGEQLSFCPMSGRAVYRSEHSNQVFLSDYLLPPPERCEGESGRYESQPNALRFAV